MPCYAIAAVRLSSCARVIAAILPIPACALAVECLCVRCSAAAVCLPPCVRAQAAVLLPPCVHVFCHAGGKRESQREGGILREIQDGASTVLALPVMTLQQGSH